MMGKSSGGARDWAWQAYTCLRRGCLVGSRATHVVLTVSPRSIPADNMSG
jgi:hypothetical protein